jgi:hypothetical protein
VVRVLLFGAVWMALLGAFAAIYLLPGRPEVKEVETQFRTPPPHAGDTYPGWTVISAYSAHHAMVLEVRADDLSNASSIAAQIVEPVKDRYVEVLIYFRDPRQAADDLPALRTQWTRQGGYVTLDYRK